jgi:hypothetical protein
MPFIRPPAPYREQIIDSAEDTEEPGIVKPRWLTWFRDIRADVDASPILQASSVGLSNQKASISATQITTEPLQAGLYRVSCVTRITVADGVSSSVVVTIAWTSGAISLSLAGGDNNGDATSSVQLDAWPLIKIDSITPITYSTVYASNTGEKMRHDLNLVLERMEI